METNSILLENINSEDLKNLIQCAVKEEMTAIQSPQGEDRFLTRLEVCGKLHLSLPTLDKHIQSGILKAYRIGGRILLKASEINPSAIPIRKRR